MPEPAWEAPPDVHPDTRTSTPGLQWATGACPVISATFTYTERPTTLVLDSLKEIALQTEAIFTFIIIE
jgi:hypothetical protein